jgi:prepilin-type processing-associated H-X9-DG protein
VREAAARAHCLNNLKQIGLALHAYHDGHKHFPPGTVYVPGLPAEKRFSWQAAVLPYFDQNPLALQLNWQAGWDADGNREPAATVLRVYLCSAHPESTDAAPAHTHYVGLAGIGADAPFLDKSDPRAGFFGYDRKIQFADLKDGASVTIAVIETAQGNGPWAAGGPATIRWLDPDAATYVGADDPFGLKHKTDTFFRSNPYIANVLYADGSTRALPAEIAPETMRALVTIAGGENVPMID